MARTMALLVMLAELSLSTGCTTFDHAWGKAATEPCSTNSIIGCWDGTWVSEKNGHNGALRCIVTQKSDGTYNGRFHAKYRKVLGFGYTVLLMTTETNGVFRFRGKANLGWWAGGIYEYEGYAHETNFFSTYSCKYDHGTFQMTRPFEPMAAARN